MFPESYESRLFTIQMLECRHMPFSPEQFVEVFRQYNEAIWPTQWILYAVALGAVLLVLSSSARVGQIVSGALASLWVWMAVAYHFAFFAAINRAAMLFGVLFLIEAFLFVLIGVKRARLSFHVDAGGGAIVGACLILYALVVYPMVGYSIGHRYPAAPTFGVPCPTTIFTFGLLLWSDRRVSWALLVIPAAWSLLGLAAALSLGVVEDYGLPVAGILGTTLILLRNHRQRAHLGPTGLSGAASTAIA